MLVAWVWLGFCLLFWLFVDFRRLLAAYLFVWVWCIAWLLWVAFCLGLLWVLANSIVYSLDRFYSYFTIMVVWCWFLVLFVYNCFVIMLVCLRLIVWNVCSFYFWYYVCVGFLLFGCWFNWLGLRYVWLCFWLVLVDLGFEFCCLRVEFTLFGYRVVLGWTTGFGCRFDVFVCLFHVVCGCVLFGLRLVCVCWFCLLLVLVALMFCCLVWTLLLGICWKSCFLCF